jgi:two-component system, chemotaxis family, chemotaxis protein CheY
VRALGEVRVLIVGWKPNTNQFLRTVLASLGLPAFTRVARTDEALTLMREHGFELVFCTGDAEPLNPAAFTRAVRHDVLGRDPTIPVFIVTASGITLNEIELMRDAGADDIFCPPMSGDAIDKKLERVLLNSRRFVTTKGFIGPDRRRSGDREFRSQDRRVSQATIFCQPPRIKKD